jgi:iron-sulfur cluster repair protein YtfE (RIC family)
MVKLADMAGAEAAFARHEHVELRAGLEQLRRAARTLEHAPRDEIRARFRSVSEWISYELMPHIAWEAAVIFPEVDEVSATTWPTKLMRFDHIQINRAVIAVERDVDRISNEITTAEQRRDAYDHLISLSTLIEAHLDREEAFLMPLIDREDAGR